MRWRRVAELLALGVILYFAGSYLSAHWQEVRRHPWELSAAPLAAATALAAVALVVFGALWARLLRASGEPVAMVDALSLWFVSNLARYVPGKVWQISGMAYLARRRGVRALHAVGASLLLQVLVLVTGVLLLAAWLPSELASAYGAGAAGVAIGCAVVVAVLFLSPLFDRGLARAAALVGQSGAVTTLSIRRKLAFGAGTALAWALYGTAFWLFLRGTLGEAPPAMTSAGIFVAGYLGGFLAFFTPGGLGVREGLYLLLLEPYFPASVALSAALLSRAWLTAIELLLAAAAGVAGRRHRVPIRARAAGASLDG
ncbi:MAG: lysylphosphatidylglycerol synthase domain-containing protein [Gemmatimonadota bacterium]